MQAAKTILVADDSDGHRKLLEVVLSAHNYRVVPVEDGHQALTYLQSHTPDLMILDVRMPFADGLEVCRRSRRLARLKPVPIIIMTSLSDAATREAAQAAGADRIVYKPITGQNLHDIIVQLWSQPRLA